MLSLVIFRRLIVRESLYRLVCEPGPN